MGNWSRKEELAEKAVRQTDEFEKKYELEIRDCVNATVVYDRNTLIKNKTNICGTPEFCVKQMTTTEAIFDSESDNICALNYASYKNPGGAFLLGSSAQEESLCHNSILFNVLREFNGYYEFNRKSLNKGMYTDRALYSNNILFFGDNKVKKCDILTCAAPNKSLIKRHGMFTEDENTKELERRIELIREIIGLQNGLDEVILGAWGCGVFKQDIIQVSELLVKYFKDANVNKVTFAIPDKRSCIIFNDAISKIKN